LLDESRRFEECCVGGEHFFGDWGLKTGY
jgi:hypothetical protein